MQLNSFIVIYKKTDQNLELKAPASPFSYFFENPKIQIYSKYTPKLEAAEILIWNGGPSLSSRIENNPINYKTAELLELGSQFQALKIDLNSGNLLATQDYLGSLPLYYYETPQQIIFANEIKNFKLFKNLKFSLNECKAIEYLASSFLDPSETIYKEIKCLCAGTYAEINNSNFKINSANDLRNSIQNTSTSNNLIDDFKSLLSAVINKNLKADSAFELSGGLDSSAVFAIAASQRNKKLKCFTIDYQISEMDEAEYRFALKEKFEFELTSLAGEVFNIQKYKEIAGNLDYLPDFPNSIQSLRILEIINSKKIPTIFTGFGGDHILAAGIRNSSTNLLNILPKSLKKLLRFKRYFPWLSKAAEDYVLSSNYNKEIDKLEFMPHQKAILYQVYHPNTAEYLRSAQNLASLYEIIKFHPLFDQEILEFCLKLPEEYLNSHVISKYILREALKDSWPQKLYKRTSKAEFSQCYYQTIRQPEFVKLLEMAVARFRQFIDADIFLKEFNQVQQGYESRLIFVIWNLIALEIFCQTQTFTET